MDELKLAQFDSISNSSNNHGYDFLKNSSININSCVSDKSCGNLVRNYYAGYNYLHFAAKNSDLASINELIRCNVDLVKQGTADGNTALHIVTGYFKTREESSFTENIMSYMGKLKENKFVETLLSAQVARGIAVNPKSKDGTSHLHIACMYNHIRAVEVFLNAGESVDHMTNDKHQLPGCTALHFAVKYSAFESAELLLKHGADIHLKDSRGKSALHCIIERLMVIANFLASGKRIYCPFYERERDTLESIVKVFLNGSGPGDIFDENGLTLLHLTSMLKDSSAIKFFFKQTMDVNATTKSEIKLWPGWTPLHFASCFSVETFKLLLCNGANLNLKNTRGETPLDLCMQRYSPDIVQSILSTKDEFRTILFTDGSTKLVDTLLLMSNDDLFKKWLDSLEDVNISIPLDSPIWPGYNLLHLAVLNERVKLDKTKMIFEAGQSFSTSRTEDGLLTYWKEIMHLLLAKDCKFNFKAKNADGLSPLYLAFKLRKTASVDMILNVVPENSEDSNGLSCFHIACVSGNTRVIERFVEDEEVNLNDPINSDFDWYTKDFEPVSVSVPASSTPLHIAVITKNVKLVKYLIKNGADMYAKDRRGLDPIHLSCINANHRDFQITKAFLNHLLDTQEFTTKENLSCLYIAVVADHGKAIEKILQEGLSSEICFEPTNSELRSKFSDDIGKTPLQMAVSRRNSEAVKALIKGGADIFATSGKHSDGLLNEMTRFDYHTDEHFISKLKRKKRYAIKPIHKTGVTSGVTVLHMACAKLDVKWARALLKRRADPNARVASSSGELQARWAGCTPLHVSIYRICYGCDKHACVVEMLELLMEYGADVTSKNGRGKTPIHMLYDGANESYIYQWGKEYTENWMSAIDVLFKSPKIFDVNPVDPHGLSHFHLACNRNQLEIVTRFLDSGVDVNHACDPFSTIKHHAGWSPLHFALEKKHSSVARLLIERGANVNAEDLRGDTPLHVAVKQGFLDAELIGLILKHGGDINAKNVKGITPIEYILLSEGFTLQQFNFMLNHGAEIDLVKIQPSGAGIIGLAMLNAESNDRLHILIRIINACDINKVIEQGGNVIDSVVNVQQKGQLTVDIYLDVIEQLMDAGCDPDLQDRAGKAALHRATSLYNHEAAKALLLLGANLNVIDKNGESPLTKQVINDKYSERRNITLNALAPQIWKAMILGLDVNRTAKRMALQVLNGSTNSFNHVNYSNLRKICIRELDKTRTTFINELTLTDFLVESKAVMQYSSMSLSDRQAIDAFFMCGDNIRRGFPELAGVLLMQYRKAVARTAMLKPAMHIIFSVGIKLPALCLIEIVQYLNYDELKLLVREY